MFKILLWFISTFLLIVFNTYAQNNENKKRIFTELEQIDSTVIKYRDSLKKQINVIWSLEDAKQITVQEGAFKKDSLANLYAEKIKKLVAISEQNISTEIRERVDNLINSRDNRQAILLDLNGVKIERQNDSINRIKGIYTTFEDGKYKKYHGEKRTTTQFVFATGINSLLEDGKLQNGELTPLRSMFYELGYTHNTRILKDNNLLHFKYGLSFIFDKLGARSDKVFERDANGIYNLEATGINYKKNMFRNTTLIIPLHLEFDLSKKSYSPSLNKSFFKSHQSARIGVGGFVGTHLQTLYKNNWKENGTNYSKKYSSSYNVEKFIYGLSAYVGYKATSFYVKYNLNPLFKNQPTDVNIISAGVRFDFN